MADPGQHLGALGHLPLDAGAHAIEGDRRLAHPPEKVFRALTDNDELAAWDRDHLLHPTTHTAKHARGDVPGRIVTGGEGVFIEDRDGNRFLDAFAALYCVNAGYGRSEIADAMSEQAHKLAFFRAFAGHGNEPAIRLAKMIMDRAPDHMARVYFGLSGSDANETNVKLAWHYNILRGRPEGFSVLSGDDGLTLAVMAAGGDGVISVISNAVPKLCAQLTDALAQSDLKTASLIHHRLAPLVDAAFIESNPIPIKAAMAMMGKMQNLLRLPLVPMDSKHEARMSAALRIAGVQL